MTIHTKPRRAVAHGTFAPESPRVTCSFRGPRLVPSQATPAGCTCAGAHLGCNVHGPQPRERAVPCLQCHAPTWSVDAICERCRQEWHTPSDRVARLGRTLPFVVASEQPSAKAS